MAKKVTRIAEAWSFVLPSDRKLPIEQQTRFTLRPLTQPERLAVRDQIRRTVIGSEGEQMVVSHEKRSAYDLALNNIVSVENFPAGAPVPWPSSEKKRVEYLAMLDDDHIVEIGDEIWGKSSIVEGSDGAVVGNSSPPARTSSSGGTSEG